MAPERCYHILKDVNSTSGALSEEWADDVRFSTLAVSALFFILHEIGD